MLKFDYLKNEKSFRSKINIFLASQVLSFRHTKQTSKNVADTAFLTINDDDRTDRRWTEKDYRWKNGWTDGQMDEQMDRQTDERMESDVQNKGILTCCLRHPQHINFHKLCTLNTE